MILEEKEMGDVDSILSTKKIRKDFVGSDKFRNSDALYDLMRVKAANKDVYKRCRRLLEDDNEVDDSVRALLSMLSMVANSELHNKRKGVDDNDDISEDNTDFYSDGEMGTDTELFFESLKKSEKSCILEIEKKGVRHVIKYDEDLSSDEESDTELRRKLRIYMKKRNGISREMPCVENKKTENMTRIRSKNKANSDKIDILKFSNSGATMDPDLVTLCQNYRIVDGHLAFVYEDVMVVIEKSDGEDSNVEKEEHDDGSASDLESIDCASFYKQQQLNPSEREGSAPQSEFRQRVTAVLRRPYDEEEYGQLCQDAELRKKVWKHMELRDRRERSIPTDKYAKSYLETHPDLRRKLHQFRDDKQKCLNLLRGFFFWLQNAVHDNSFKPWQDEECLAI